MQNSILLLKRALRIQAKTVHPLSEQWSYQNIFQIYIKIDFHIFDVLISFIGGSHQKNILNIHQNWYFHIFRFVHLFIYYHLSHFWFLLLFSTTEKDISRLYKKHDQKYPLQHSRNLVYHNQPLIHHLQVIPHEHLSRLNMIINTLLPIRKRTTY